MEDRREISVKDLSPDTYLQESLYLDQDFLLLVPELPVTKELIGLLQEWGYLQLFSQKEDERDSFVNKINEKPEKAERKERNGRKEARAFYHDILVFVARVVVHFEEARRLDLENISNKVKEILEITRSHGPYILRFPDLLEQSPDGYLVAHLARSTIIALALGDQLRLPNHKLIELGVSAFLHETGVNKSLKQLLLSPRKLTLTEMKLMRLHPILGYRLLKQKSLSHDTLMGVLEHHERLNGSGYPYGKEGESLSLFGRIIAIACFYEAMISTRPHRGASSSYQTLMTLLKERGKQFDEAILRRLLALLSLYPLGSFVRVENGKTGVIVGSDPKSPDTPTIKLLLDSKGCRLKERSLVKAKEDSPYHIREVLDDDEPRLKALC